MSAPVLKQPAEQLVAPLAQRRPALSVEQTLVAPRGLVPGAAALFAVPAIDGGAIALTLTGGGDGERYLVTVRYQADGGELLEDELEVAVVDGAWAMPDGATPYLSIAEFVARFGLAETIVMTQADGSGRIDRDYLVAALRAAQGLVDLSLAARYAVPLAVVPEAVKGMVADLARARLYPRGMPEGVAALAKSAERALERIASGALPLPLPAGEAATPATSDPVLISGRGRRAYPRGLDDFR